MNWFTNLFSDGASKVVDSVGNAIDRLVTSDEEKLQLRNVLQDSMNSFQLQMEIKSVEFEQEITKRWTSDNEHIVTRLVRPMSFVYVLVVFTAIAIADGNIGGFKVNAIYVPVFEALLGLMTVAYFGSRGVEKSIKHFKK